MEIAVLPQANVVTWHISGGALGSGDFGASFILGRNNVAGIFDASHVLYFVLLSLELGMKSARTLDEVATANCHSSQSADLDDPYACHLVCR
jgi:hypothetical protein